MITCSEAASRRNDSGSRGRIANTEPASAGRFQRQRGLCDCSIFESKVGEARTVPLQCVDALSLCIQGSYAQRVDYSDLPPRLAKATVDQPLLSAQLTASGGSLAWPGPPGPIERAEVTYRPAGHQSWTRPYRLLAPGGRGARDGRGCHGSSALAPTGIVVGPCWPVLLLSFVGAKSDKRGRQLFRFVLWTRLLQHKCTWYCAAAGTYVSLAPTAAGRG